MVISSNLTTRLDSVVVVSSLNRIRSLSAPSFSTKSTRTSPDRRRKERKRRFNPAKFILDKPPFVNYASSYINPYRNLTPIIINHDHRRRSKSKKRSKRKVNNNEKSNTSIRTESTDTEESSFSKQIIENTNPIDLWPSDPNAFHMDFLRRRQIAIDNTGYRETIQTWKPTSLQHLSTLVKELTKDQHLIDQVWTIFYWISQNIAYDINSEADCQYLKQKVDEVFLLRKTTYEGYATLFKTLCDCVGIKCIVIVGYAKDLHFQTFQETFTQINHMWNAVQLDGDHWYLIDSVLGSGYIDFKYEYKKDLKTHYFLTRPENLIYSHFPKDSQSQFLSKAILMFDFFRLPYLHSYYFIYELTVVSPRFSSIVPFNKDESYAEVLIQAPNDVQLTSLIKNDYKGTSLMQYDASRHVWQCLFAPHKVGCYTLLIYANRPSTSHIFHNAIELGVEISSRDFTRKRTLPRTFGKFIEAKCQLFSPLDGVLKRGIKANIHCRIPNGSLVKISIDDVWLEDMPVKDDIFKHQITVPEREIMIYAQFNTKKSNNNFYGLIRYAVEK